MALFPSFGGMVDLATILRSKNFSEMHPTMRERLEALMAASDGALGWMQGVRTSQQQMQMFLDRYAPDPNGETSWQGQRWKHVKGAAAAPPGRSMHEIGLAADMKGDMGWLAANCAKFGLQTFQDVNHEPWHVQPVELPRGRVEYEKQGSIWGALPNYVGGGGAAPPPPAAKAADRPMNGGSIAAPPPSTGPTLTPALVAMPGDSGPAARVLMEALVARGLLADVPESRDGGYGASDQALVEQFQRDNGLVVDGQVGPQTWSKLLATVEPGDKGAIVKVLQTTLIVRGLIKDNPSNLDGDYGPMTQQRVRDFQSVSGIDPIAKVGPQTWTALLGVKRSVEVSGRGDDDEVQVDLDDIDVLAELADSPAT